MRFVHTADLHLGAVPDASSPWSTERAAAVRETLPVIIKLTNEVDADLLLIAGDLFNRQPLNRELKEVSYYFSRLKRAKVVLIAGNHDYITADSPYIDYPWADNVHFLTSSALSSIYFDDLQTEVHGLSYYSREITEPIYDGVRAPSDGHIHILLAHGGDASHAPIHLPDLAASGYNYVALGHIHRPRIFKNTRIAYSGSPEPLDRTDTGVRGCIIGDVTTDGFSLKWQTLARTQYRDLEISTGPEITQAALEDDIRSRIGEHPEDIYSIRLIGTRDPDMIWNRDSIMTLGRVIAVSDETEPAYDLSALAADHAGDLISHYINALNVPDATPVMKKALFYGLRALLDS